MTNAVRLSRQDLYLPTMQAMIENGTDALDVAHFAEIERRQAVAGNLRWVKGTIDVASKTSKGILVTKLNADDTISHTWTKH